MTSRLDYIDAVKGFAIFLVVMAHTIGWSFADWTFLTCDVTELSISQINASFIWKLVYSFHMPLFFLISGLFTYKLNVKLLSYIVLKVKRLLIPYISTGFFMLFLKGYYGYWFLFSLFELSVIGIILFRLLACINKKNYWQIDGLGIIIAYVICRVILKHSIFENPFCDVGKAVDYMLPFLCGMFLSKHKFMYNKLIENYRIYIPILIFMFAWKYLPLVGVDNSLFYIGNIVNRYCFSILASLMIIGLFKFECSARMKRILAYFGKNTIYIYIYHLFFVIQLNSLGEFWLSTNLPTCITTQLLYSILVSGIAILLSCIIAKFLQKSNLLSKVLFGVYK